MNTYGKLKMWTRQNATAIVIPPPIAPAGWCMATTSAHVPRDSRDLDTWASVKRVQPPPTSHSLATHSRVQPALSTQVIRKSAAFQGVIASALMDMKEHLKTETIVHSAVVMH